MDYHRSRTEKALVYLKSVCTLELSFCQRDRAFRDEITVENCEVRTFLKGL